MASYKISYVPQTVSVFELSSISTRNGQATSAYQVKQQHLDSSALDSWLATLPGTQNAAPATVLRMVSVSRKKLYWQCLRLMNTSVAGMVTC